MKKTLLGGSCVCGILLFLAACFCPATVNAAGGVQYQFNAAFTNTDDSNPAGPGPYVTATFLDGSPGDVFLTVTDLNLTSGEFVSSVFFNLTSAYNPADLNFSFVSSNGVFQPDIQTAATGQTGFKADGDGYYDIEIDFGNHAFSTDSSITWEITDSSTAGLDATNFIQLSSEGGGAGTYDAAVKVQGLGPLLGNSTFLYPTAEGQIFPVPEPMPATIGSLGAGLLVSARWWLRRKKSS